MRKVVIYIAMSLDGYIADQDGGVTFLGGDGTDDTNWGSFPGFFETVGDVVMGYKTYHQVVTELAPDQYPYSGKMSYVLTHQQLENKEDIVFTSSSVKELLHELKSADRNGDIWICGGASIVTQVLEQGLADEITISVIPTLLGSGIPLIEKLDKKIKLQLISTTSYNGITDLTYKVRN